MDVKVATCVTLMKMKQRIILNCLQKVMSITHKKKEEEKNVLGNDRLEQIEDTAWPNCPKIKPRA